MRNFVAVLMLMFITVAFSNVNIQPSDTDISIEQIMVKPLDVGVVNSLEFNTVEFDSVEYSVLADNKGSTVINTLDLFETDEHRYKQSGLKDVPIQLLTFNKKENLTYDSPDSGIPIC